MQDLPLTFRDAIFVTRKLGFKYLWIDSLAIIQDDADDWRREAASMAAIYSNASVTIAASMSNGHQKGFLKPTKPARRMFIPSLRQGKFSGIAYARLQSSDYRLKHWSPMAKRGWILQEQCLSRRILHFYSDQIWFQCAHHTASEDGVATYKCDAESGGMTTHYVERSLGPGLRYTLSQSPNSILDKRGCWWSIVENYTARKLTYPSDRIPALAGVTKLFQELTSDEPLLGLWRSDFAVGLLWRTKINTDDPAPARFENIPSWSWFSIHHQVMSHRFDEYRIPVSCLEVLDVQIDWSGIPLTSEVLGGKAVIRGRVQKMKLGAKQRDSFDFHDHFRLHSDLLRKWRAGQVEDVGACQLDDPTKVPETMVDVLNVTEHRTWTQNGSGKNIRCIIYSVIILDSTGCKEGEYRRIGCGTVEHEFDFDEVEPKVITLI